LGTGFITVKALCADGIELVDEDDGRRLLMREGEGVSHELRTVTDEHLHELRSRQLQETRVRLRSAGASQQSLPSTS
jgi:hypothetical protein